MGLDAVLPGGLQLRAASTAPLMWTLLLVGVLKNPTAAQFLVPPDFDAVSYCVLQQSQAFESGDCGSAVLFQGYQRSTTEEAIELVEHGLWWPQVSRRVQEVADEWAPMMQQERRRSEQSSLGAHSAGASARLPGRVLRYASVAEDGRWHNVSGKRSGSDEAQDGHRHRHAMNLQRPEPDTHLEDNGSLVGQKQAGPRHVDATMASPPRWLVKGGTASSKNKQSDSRSRTNRVDVFATEDERRLALVEIQDGQWHNATLALPPSPQKVTGNHSSDKVVEIQAEASAAASMPEATIMKEPSRSPLSEHWRVALLASLAHAISHARRLWDDGSGYTQTFVFIGVNLVLGILLCIGLVAAFRGRSSRELSLGGDLAVGQQSPQPQQAGTIQPPRFQPASVSPRPPEPVPFRERGEPFEPSLGGITSPHPEPRDLSLRGKMNAAATLAASPLLMATPSRSIEDSAARDERPSITDAILCVGLIVPEECECTLLVPHLAPRPISTQVIVEDVERTPALKAVFHLPTQEGRCLILSDVDETSNMFAYCVRDFSNLALTVYGAEQRHFGVIRMRGSRSSAGFEVITRKQAQLHIRCATNGEPRTFTDGHGRLLAVAEPVPDEHALRVVRIGPGVDAGLVVLSTLASDLLKATLALEANQQS